MAGIGHQVRVGGVGWRQSLSLIDDDGFLTQSSTVRILFNFVEKMDE